MKGFKLRTLVSVIFFRIFRTTVYSTAALAFCAWIVQSSRYLDMLNINNISLAKFFRFTSYLSVDIIAVILPISLAISGAFIYQRFKESSQLTALQAAGISPRMMLTPLMALATIVLSYLYVSNFFISPYSWKSFRSLEFEIRNNIEPPESAGLIFSNNNFSVYAQNYSGNLSFKNIFIIDSRIPNKSSAYFAKFGTIKNNVLYLNDGERIEMDYASQRSSVMNFASYNYDLKQILNSEKKAAQPNEKFPSELLEKCADQTQTLAQKALFHQKMTSPWLAVIFSLLAFWLILLAPYTRKQTYIRMGILILLIVAFQGTYFWIVNAAAKSPNFTLLNYVMVFSALACSAFLALRKVKAR